MTGFFSFILDLALIGLLIAGIVYAVRLSRQIAGLRASRDEMERFVAGFGATVDRAEAGVRSLKHVARTSGDDLEQLIEKALQLRDELHFLVESADRLAERISSSASASLSVRAENAPEQDAMDTTVSAVTRIEAVSVEKTAFQDKDQRSAFAGGAPSAAERELMQALKKLG